MDVLISPNADQADRLRAIHDLGLDLPLWQQYLTFLVDAMHGDLGRSFVYNVPALQLILQHMPATMELATAAVLLSVLIGVPLGLCAGLRPHALLARAVMAGSVLGFSLPTFWVGLMMIVAFSVHLGWLPSSGRGRTAELFGVEWSFLTVDGLRHMLLPEGKADAALSEVSACVRDQGPGMRRLRDFAASPVAVAVAALVAVVLIVLAAVLAPWIAPQNPYDLGQLDMMDTRLPPGSPASAGFTYLLGTDDQGRDMLSGILYGLRTSLVGVGSAAFAAVLGSTLGLVVAYAGGRVEAAVMRLVDLQLSFPSILVALMILAVLGKGVLNVVLALVLVEWAYYARVARASALAERRREYIEAAECLALPRARIVFRHLLPNCLPPLIVVATMQVACAITLEATLSFLGIGVPITEPSLGLLIANGYKYVLSGQYWISFYPGIALLLTIVSINLVGDRVRDVPNPRAER